MPKPIRDLRVSILVPCYKRPEYTKRCLDAICQAQKNYYYLCDVYVYDDGSQDGTDEIIYDAMINGYKKEPMLQCFFKENFFMFRRINKESEGLRNIILDFFEEIKPKNYDFIFKIDNDCLVPKNWLDDILKVFENSDADILSPNVHPSNAAFKYGREDTEGKGYRPAEIVGGLWIMKTSLIKDMDFERHELNGLTGAISILKQIVVEKEPNIGWVPDVIVQDIGHWSGKHPDHIKSEEHQIYSKEVGRQIAWNV